MALLSLITEQSTVPCYPTVCLLLGGHFGVVKKKSEDHFGIDLGIILGLGIISGSGSFRGLYRSFASDMLTFRPIVPVVYVLCKLINEFSANFFPYWGRYFCAKWLSDYMRWWFLKSWLLPLITIGPKTIDCGVAPRRIGSHLSSRHTLSLVVPETCSWDICKFDLSISGKLVFSRFWLFSSPDIVILVLRLRVAKVICHSQFLWSSIHRKLL